MSIEKTLQKLMAKYSDGVGETDEDEIIAELENMGIHVYDPEELSDFTEELLVGQRGSVRVEYYFWDEEDLLLIKISKE